MMSAKLKKQADDSNKKIAAMEKSFMARLNKSEMKSAQLMKQLDSLKKTLADIQKGER